MQFWRIVSPEQFDQPALLGHHAHWLYVPAIALAILAAWVLLPVAERYHATLGRSRYLWLGLGSLAMGVGIWAMHFTAMLAFNLPVPIAYDGAITLLSILPAVVSTATCIALYDPSSRDTKRLHLAALVMAVGIGTMHYLGMGAVIVSAGMYYDPALFLLSIAAAYVLALGGLHTHDWLVQRYEQAHTGRLAGSAILGLAVSSMHFIAMRATYFQPIAEAGPMPEAIDETGLLLGVIIGTIILLSLVVIASMVDRRFEALGKSLRLSERRFERVAAAAQTAIFTFDEHGVTYANPALSRMTGHDEPQIAELSLAEIFSPAFAAFALGMLRDSLPPGTSVERQFEIEHAAGGTRWLHFSMTLADPGGETTGIGSAMDFTELKAAERRMERLAFSDQLTGVANRALFVDRLQHHLDIAARRASSRSCVLLLDLDNFKPINENYGHVIGDRVLTETASRLQDLLRRSDTVARLSGDEFVVLVEELDNEEREATIAERIVRALGRPIRVDGREIEISASIGLVQLSAAYRTPDQVLRDADTALHRAKVAGRARWVVFDEALGASSMRARRLLTELKTATAEGRIELYYQPIVDADGLAIAGFEALARWRRDDGEWVSPGEFIPLAEEAGLITDIDLWAVRAAAAQLSELTTEAGWVDGYLSVNVAASTIRDDRLLGLVREMNERYGLRRGRLKLELTERTLVDEADETLGRLDALIDAGCELMIDDFGTGYSSLAYLHRFPIATVKIDRGFVASLGSEDNAEPVIKTIRALAETLDMRVVAEGVETQFQSRKLAELGIDQLQGYLFGKPRPGPEVLRALKRSELLEVVENSALMRVLGRRSLAG